MPAEPEPTLSTLVAGAVADVRTLVQGEIELAKAELNRSAKRGATGGGLIGLAIFFALFALLMLAFSAAYGLVKAGLDPWAAFLIIGAVMLVVTAVLGWVASRQFKKITGPVLAQEEMAKTQALLAARKAAVVPPLTTAPAAETPAPSTESDTVFPSYAGRPPTP